MNITLATASTTALVTATVGQATAVDTAARTITGMVVPYGVPGHTSGGALQFSRGSIQLPADPSRVKLLREHDQTGVVLGHALSFTDTDRGLYGTFSIATGPAGDTALAEAADKLRDAFSVGVQLDATTLQRVRRSNGATVAAAGLLREVSQVSVPAYDDARMGAATTSGLTAATWTPPTTALATAANHREETPMRLTEEQRARLAALRAQDTLTQAEAAELSQLTALDTDEPDAAPAASQAAASTATVTAAGPTAPATATPATASAPATVTAAAGGALVTGEPATYEFAGDSQHSLITDLLRSSLRGDAESGERVARFNAELADGNPASLAVIATAAATRDNVDGSTPANPLSQTWGAGPTPRPDLMRSLVDVKRPFISRLNRVPITNAQPFSIPKVGEFSGVGAHTEGTPHRTAGTLSLSGNTITPTATSGAWEASRELLDAANPALDPIAVRAMLRDYQRQTEGKIMTLLAARAAQEGSTVYDVDGVVPLRSAMLNFVNDDEEAADIVGVSKAYLELLATELDGTDRPQLPFVGPVNATGTTRAGYTGVAIDGTEVFRAARLDAALGTDVTDGGAAGVLARSEGILWAESSVMQFRFNEVKGPGVVVLALWAYSGAAILDTADVQIVRAGAEPAGD